MELTQEQIKVLNFYADEQMKELKKICNQSCNECKYNKDGTTCKFSDCGDVKLHLIEKLINQIEGKK